MELSIGKWGNSLALRIPAEVARMMRVVEGSKLAFELDAHSGRAVLTKPTSLDLQGHFEAVQRRTSQMKITPHSVVAMRESDRY